MTLNRRTLLTSTGALGAAAALAACGSSDSSGAGDATTASSASGDSGGGATSSPAASPSGEVLGPVDQVPVGGGVVYDGPKVVVTQPAQGEIRGFSAVCPHQGCLMAGVQDNVIVCPCHNSLFSAEDGALISGPSPTGLPAVNVSVVNSDIILA